MTRSLNETDRQRELFRCNRAVQSPETASRIAELESSWIGGVLADLEETTPEVASRQDWVVLLEELLAEEAKGGPALHFLADEASWDQFRDFVREFAPDGLTEAQNFFPAIARLPIRSQMALMRVLIDEFGCGNLLQMHTYLYQQLLAELGLPEELDAHVDRTAAETLQLLNVFYWLTQRAPTIEYFLGALAYLEASIPAAFLFLAQGCRRLGIEHSRYYTEHMHIDEFHMKEMRTAVRELETDRGLDARKVWIGSRMLSEILGTAVDAEVDRLRAAV